MQGILLIVGLGNPGDRYQDTRHNAGNRFLQALADKFAIPLRSESRFKGYVGQGLVGSHQVRILQPSTYMNHSGESVLALSHFFRITPERILVAHDELDHPPGVVRLKRGGGDGGHNGLRDISSRLGSKDYLRLRIGIGRPDSKAAVESYVLKPPGQEDAKLISAAIDDALSWVEDIVQGDFERVMNTLHTVKA